MQDEGDGLNDSQRLFVLTRFSKIDALFQEIARSAEPDVSPFSRYESDVPGGTADELARIGTEIRSKMLETLGRLRVKLPAPDLSSRWTVQTSLTFIDVVLSGMTENELHGYGEVDQHALQLLESAVEEIKCLIEKARRVVSNIPEEDDEAY